MSEESPQPLPHESIRIDDELELRALRPENAEEFFLLTDENRGHLGKWLPWVEGTTDVSGSLIFIEKTIGERKDGEGYGFGIIQKGKLVGHISLMHVGQVPEIGYWVAESVSGQGVTTKAAQAVTDFGFNVLGLDKITIRARPANSASNRVAEKLGYELIDTQTDTGGGHNIWVKKAQSKNLVS